MAKGMWWDRAWRLTRGCTKVSPGCDHCWAEREAHMRGKNPNTKVRDQYGMTDAEGRWTGKVDALPLNLNRPLMVKKPQVWTVWNDLYHGDVPWNFVFDAYRIMAQCPQHLFLILTKRPGNMKLAQYDIAFHLQRNFPGITWPLPNVWLGVTAENQEQADKRIPDLLQAPAAVWFLSVEPMLGPVDLNKRECLIDKRLFKYTIGNYLDLVICGGESGPGARPMETEWAVDLREQCRAVGVAFWMKQMRRVNGKITTNINDFPPVLRVREWPGVTK